MSKLKIGDTAPVTFNNPEYLNKKILLYFYPKDNTPGSTAEACNLRDNYQELKKLGFEVIGVSPDSETSHLKFKEKQQIPFELIADTDKQIAMSYGVYGTRKVCGKECTGIIRTTFIINDKGIIENIIEKVNTKEHAKQIFDLYK